MNKKTTVAEDEVDRLREALHMIAHHACENGRCMHSAVVAEGMRKIARKALRTKIYNVGRLPDDPSINPVP